MVISKKTCCQHQGRFQILNKTTLLLMMAILAMLLPCTVSTALDPAGQQLVSVPIDGCSSPPFPLGPVYRIPLRVHIGESKRSMQEFRDILNEINHIWLSQAGILFVMQVVLDDEPSEQGMDIWFMPVLQGNRGMNGYFRSDHDIQVRDTPVLKPAEHPARYPAARTAAHEFGHGLSLPHRQDSDDNLMRSKTYGWQLNAKEIRDARKAAAEMALTDVQCAEDAVVNVVRH